MKKPGKPPRFSRVFYVQDERYFAKEHKDVRREAFQVRINQAYVQIFKYARPTVSRKEHKDKVRPQSGREGGLGHVRCDCSVVAWRFSEDVRREAFQVWMN